MKGTFLNWLALLLSECFVVDVPRQGIQKYLRPSDEKPLALDTIANSHHVSTAHRGCENTPSSRRCWGDYDIDTDYYNVFPDTGKVVEVWLSAEEALCSPDGYERICMTFNGTMPGPLIEAS